MAPTQAGPSLNPSAENLIADQSDAPRAFEIGGDGCLRTMPSPPSPLMRRFPLRKPYRLYRFLSDLDDLVVAVKHDRERLRIAAILVRHLLSQSEWIAQACPPPDPQLGWGLSFLYDEPGYPFTVQVVSWLPGESSPVHNHAAWSIVTLLGDPSTAGQEKNQLWQRQDDGSQPGHALVTPADDVILRPGDLVGFMPEAIHSVTSVPTTETDPQPTYTFNVYGATDFNQRFEFDPEKGTAVNF